MDQATLPQPVSLKALNSAGSTSLNGMFRCQNCPTAPTTTPFAKSTPDAGYVAKHVPFSSMRDEDPREALLKYETKQGDKMFTAAWAATQPVTQYADLSDEEEKEVDEEGRQGPERKKTKM